MSLSNLKRAQNHKINEWLIQELQLNAYQKSILWENDIVRRSEFYFYEPIERVKGSFVWRLTLIFYPIYVLLLMIIIPFVFLFTGRWGLGSDYVDNFHNKWLSRLGIS